MPDPLRVLCLNSGSSSLKFARFDLGAAETRIASGSVEGIGSQPGRLWIRTAGDGPPIDTPGEFPDARKALQAAFAALGALDIGAPDAIGHRLVQGGPDHQAPERIDAELVATLRRLTPLAPLHLPAAIDGIEATAAHFPGVPQIACFDTSFHRGMPEVAQRLPLPRHFWDEGLRRYGFHGLSYEYVVEEVGAAALGRAVIAHLGNGASAVAVLNGHALDTTMGFTPTGGLMMGTRSGDLDPGVLLYLLSKEGYDWSDLVRLVDHESGLLAVSGGIPDMKTLLERRAREPHLAQAVEMFCYQVRKSVGALTTVLGGLDNLVFTGGIGEHAPPVRWEVCQGLAHLGIRLDPNRNDVNEPIISAPASTCTVRVVPADEDLMIARHTRRLLAHGAR